MAFRIPSFADLPEVNPRPSGTQPVYPADDPGAAGLAAFGKGVSAVGGSLANIGADREEARQKLNESNSTLDLVNRVVPLMTKISIETDPNKIVEYRKELDSILPTSAQAIDDPQRKQAWMASHAKTILNAHSDADKRFTGLYRGQAKADGLTRLDQFARTGASSGDPNAIPGTLAEMENNLEWQQKNGSMTALEVREYRNHYTRELIGGTVRRLMHQGRNEEAFRVLDQNPDALDANTHENLRNTIQTGRNKSGGLRAVDEALGIVPAQTPRSSGGMGVGGAIGTRVAQALRARGWSESAIIGALNNSLTESSWDPRAKGAAREEGLFQFHPRSHLTPFKQSYGNDWSPEAQANYVADVIEKEAPGYPRVGDARTATSRFLREFEKPKDQGEGQLANRLANTKASEAALRGPGGGRSPFPPGQKFNSRGEAINLEDAPGQQISAAQVTPARTRDLARANAVGSGGSAPTDEELAAAPQALIPLDNIGTALVPSPPTRPGAVAIPPRIVPAPSYFQARDAIMRNPNLNPESREYALDQLAHRFTRDSAVIRDLETRVKDDFANQQKAVASSLLGRVIRGEQLDTQILADLVETQHISDDQYRAIRVEASREVTQDDIPTFSAFSRRAYAGEDISADLWKAVANKQLKGTTAEGLQRTANSRRERGEDQVERAAYATLRTSAGMDAQERPMVDLDKTATANQMQLWSLAQQEWNRRVMIGQQDPQTGQAVREEPSAVLADMLPRYGRPIDNVAAYPKPRMGAVTKIEELPAVIQKTYEAHSRGGMTDAQLAEEEQLLDKLRSILEAQQKRAAAAATVPAPKAGDNAARGRVKAQ